MLVFVMLASVISCSNVPVNNDGTSNDGKDTVDSTSDTDTVTETANTNIVPAEKYDGVFKAGFARTVITPELPAPVDEGMDDNVMKKVKDDMYATCIAVNDGENTALIYTVDVKNIGPVVYSTILLRVSVATKVPKENIILSATHDHSAFTPLDNPGISTSQSLIKWTANLPGVMANIAKEAIKDMEDAEIYVGNAKTTGMAFIRRYVHEDGSYSGVWTGDHLKSTSKVVGQVMDVDDTLQVVRFVRREKKDIIMTNWQAHLASARDVFPVEVTADLAYYVRKKVESNNDDTLVAYFAGASGNVGLTPPSDTFRKYANYSTLGTALGDLVLKTIELEKLTKIEAGKIKGTAVTYAAEARRDSAEKVAQAKEVMALEEGSDAQIALMTKYGFESLYAPRVILSCNSKTVTSHNLYLSAISFGDLSFIGAPYEMFDNNGMQIKEGSPFNTTFILTGSGGYWAYMPSIEYWNEYGGYEVDDTMFAKGTAEKLVAEFLRMLNEHKGIS